MSTINEQINVINSSLEWIKAHRPEHYETRYLELVGLRRRLRKIYNAEREKPAIAAFGESQKGKSYLIGNLLQKQKAPFLVRDEKGEQIDFVARVNPIGDNKEATGVVTRFTPFIGKGHEERYCAEHPVIVKLFNISDLATILCDSYYSDLKDPKFYADADIKSFTEKLYAQYIHTPETQSHLVEDDILDIKAYCISYLPTISDNLLRAGYFDTLALVVRRIPIPELANALKPLWHENRHFTGLFTRLLTSLQKLNFAREVYVNFDAVMHFADNTNTIMSVNCLRGLEDPNWNKMTNVYIPNGGSFTTVPNFPKCELCALCMETIFKIDTEFLNDEDRYYFETAKAGQPGFMSSATQSFLPQTVKKDLLAHTDLLDFPGARSRLQLEEVFLDRNDSGDSEKGSNLVQILLRGKVAYLFNNYSDSRILNILLLCHDSIQVAATGLYQLIDGWVKQYVGENATERKNTVRRCGGIAPLFLVATKFNMDMIEKGDLDGDSEAGLNGRWFGRFNTILWKELISAKNVDWFHNWDEQGNSFKNTYLLRDYKYSSCGNKGNKLYQGYDETKGLFSETALNLTPEFYDRLRSTFISNDDVKMFFEDPERAWDVAASMNNDGALYVIQQLAIVSKHMADNREQQFNTEVSEVRRKLLNIMGAYYISDDTSEILKTNIRKASSIFREMDFTCQNHPEFFGNILHDLQLTEAESFKKLHDLIPKLTSTVNENKELVDYEMIRRRCDNFNQCETEDSKWAKLIERYHFADREDASDYLKRRNIDIKQLFGGSEIKKKNSAVITHDLIDLWKKNITSASFNNIYSSEGLIDEIVLNNLVQCIIDTASNVDLQEIIETEITEYVDILNVAAINEKLVADMIATKISDFVVDFGFSYLTEEQQESSRRVANEHHLPCFYWIDKERKEIYEEDEITALFNDILNINGSYTQAYEANYNTWLEYMHVAHIAHLNVPNFDHEANDKLKKLLEKLQ